MPHANLSEAFCKRLAREVKGWPPRKIEDFYSDPVPKLSLRASGPSSKHQQGVLAWRFAYRFNGRQQKVKTIGHYPTWTSEQAHTDARKRQRLLDQGLDPETILNPPTPPVALPIKQLIDDYLNYVEDSGVKLNYIKDIRSQFERYVRSQWEKPVMRDASSISYADVVALVNKVRRSTPAPAYASRTNGMQSMAEHVEAQLSAMFTWAVWTRRLPATPVITIPKSAGVRRRRQAKPKPAPSITPEAVRTVVREEVGPKLDKLEQLHKAKQQANRNKYEQLPAALRRITNLERKVGLVEDPRAPRDQTSRRPLGEDNDH
jgi:hypothetical protein